MSTTLTRLRALEAAATKGPWMVHHAPNKVHANEVAKVRGLFVYGEYGAIPCSDDAALIAALRNAAPALLKVAEAAAAVIGQNVTRPEVYDIAGDSRHAILARSLASLAALDAGGE